MLARRKSGRKNLLKMGFLIHKTLRMKNLNYLKKGIQKAIFKTKKKKWKVTRGQWWSYSPYEGRYRLSLRRKVLSWVQLC